MYELNAVYPQNQEKVSEIIVRIIRKENNEEDKVFLENCVNDLIKKGAEIVLLACTDLGNIIKNKNTIDTTKILIEAIKKEMFKN